jgi:hypothetical protein
VEQSKNLNAAQTGKHRVARLVLNNREGKCMAVYPLFKNEAFEPEAIVRMTRVYADVCQTLGLSDHDHRETKVVAIKIIEFAQRGARDPILLRDCVLEALRDKPKSDAQGPAPRQAGL